MVTWAEISLMVLKLRNNSAAILIDWVIFGYISAFYFPKPSLRCILTSKSPDSIDMKSGLLGKKSLISGIKLY